MGTKALLVPGFGERFFTLGLTSSDATAPVLTTTPFAASIQDTSVTTRTVIQETGFPATFYVVVLADGATAPSAAQIRAGTDSSDVAQPSNSTVFNEDGATVNTIVGGLTASTAYDVYYTARDAFDNDTTPGFYNVTTTAASSAEILALSSNLIHDLIAELTINQSS